MPALNPPTSEQLALAKAALTAGIDVLEAIQAGRIAVDSLPIVNVTVEIPESMPSRDVAEMIARNDQARAEYERQTRASRAASVVIQVAMALAKNCLPFIGLLCVVAAFVSAGCQVNPGALQVGPTSQPVVQVGSTTQPIATADVDVLAPIASPVISLDPSVGQAGVIDASAATTQPFNAPVTTDQRGAGRDARQIAINVNASGSGWPVAAVLAMGVGLAFLSLYYRSTRAHQATRRSYQVDQANAVSVARSIRAMGPGPQQDRLVGMINSNLPDRERWNDVMCDHCISVKHPVGPASTAR